MKKTTAEAFAMLDNRMFALEQVLGLGPYVPECPHSEPCACSGPRDCDQTTPAVPEAAYESWDAGWPAGPALPDTGQFRVDLPHGSYLVVFAKIP